MRKNKGKKRRDKNTTINVVSEFDYDKLAEAIINAQQIQKQEQVKVSISNKELLKSTIEILKGKKDTKGNFVAGLFTLIVIFFLRVIELVGVLFFCYFIYFFISIIIKFTWEWQLLFYNVMLIIFSVSVIVFVVLLTLFIHVSANEIEKTEDKNLVFTVFSSLTGFVALIVAFVALKN